MNYSQVLLWNLAALASVAAASVTAAASASTLPKPNLQKSESSTLTSATVDGLVPRSQTTPLDQRVDQDGTISLDQPGPDTVTLKAVANPSPAAAPSSSTLNSTAAIAPVTSAASLTVVQLVEPGTGTAWSPTQTASALTNADAELAQVSLAQPSTAGWYVALTPEVVFGYDIDTDGGDVTVPIVPAPGLPPVGTTTVPLDASIDTDTGFGINGAVGYRFDNARVEFEVGYNSNSVDRVTFNDVSVTADGSIDNWKFLLNGYYDFPTGSRFSPYVGGGAGIAILSADDVSATVPTLGEVSIDDSNASFLFQFKAGVGYDVTETLNAFLGYRLMGIPGQSFEVLGTDLDADTLFIHSLQIGARYEF